MKGWYWTVTVDAVHEYSDNPYPELNLRVTGAWWDENATDRGLPRAGESFFLVPAADFERLSALDKEETPGPQYSSDGTLIGWVPSTEHPLPEFFPEPHWQPEWGKDPRQTEPRQA